MLKTSSEAKIDSSSSDQALSVVICAKNEASNLKKHLPKILEQDYPDFQVVVVNDCSTDDTDMVLAHLKSKYEQLYYTNIPNDKKFYQGKKLALTLGVKAAKHERLILTDADCQPTSDKWLRHISASFVNEKEIVIGHGRFTKKTSLFNLFLRYETFWNAVQYMGFALRGLPFMAVGRNMAYNKSLFLKSDVFKRFLNVASGDDDLFMRSCATATNTAICIKPEAQTESIAPKNFSDWTTRKARHLTTAPHYTFKIKSLLFFEALTRQLFWGLTICSLFFPTFALIGLGLFIVKTAIQYIVLAKAAKKMGEEKLYLASLLFDAIIPIIIGSIWLINIFSGKNKKWK
ncbi:glycosyltransferase [Marinilabiliaceae bacterium N1Y90]|nr:glycosyltransferase [Marinilabiliaceae bacterium N1Y90]